MIYPSVHPDFDPVEAVDDPQFALELFDEAIQEVNDTLAEKLGPLATIEVTAAIHLRNLDPDSLQAIPFWTKAAASEDLTLLNPKLTYDSVYSTLNQWGRYLSNSGSWYSGKLLVADLEVIKDLPCLFTLESSMVEERDYERLILRDQY